MSAGCMGVEIGGTKLQIVWADDQGRLEHRRRLAVDPRLGGAGIRRQLETALRDRPRDYPEPRGVGVGFGGPVDWETGVIQCSHQIEGWAGFGLGEWLHEVVQAPVWVDNDANVAALGEACRGAGQGFDPVFYVTLGSGVGGGLVVGGRIYHGAKPGEAEIGHVRLDRQGTTVESRCSGWAVDRRIREFQTTDPGGALARLTRGTTGGEARQLGPALAAGDPAALRLLEETAGDLAWGLSHVVHLLHPARLVLGGGLSLLGEVWRAAVARALSSLIMPAFAPGPSVVLAQLGEDAVPVGAVVLAQSGAVQGGDPAILIMDQIGTPGEGTRPTRGRFCGGVDAG